MLLSSAFLFFPLTKLSSVLLFSVLLESSLLFMWLLESEVGNSSAVNFLELLFCKLLLGGGSFVLFVCKLLLGFKSISESLSLGMETGEVGVEG